MPQRPPPNSPLYPPPQAVVSSYLLLLYNVQWSVAVRSGPAWGPACFIGHTVGGGSFPPPESSRCQGHAGVGSASALPSSLPLIPGIPPPGSSAGLPSPVRSSLNYEVQSPRPGCSIAVVSPPPSHVESSYDSSGIPPPTTLHMRRMIPVPSTAPCTWALPP